MKKLTQRNQQIYFLYVEEKVSPYEIASKYKLTPPRVYAIIKQVKEELKKENKTK